MLIRKIIFIIILFLSNIVQTVAGFAGTVLAMPISIKLVGVGIAKPILNLIALITGLFILIKNIKRVSLKDALFMLLFLLIGFIIGIFIERFYVGEYLLKIYGVIICLIAICFLTIKKDLKIPNFLLYIILIIAGILHKLYISGGPLVVVYATYKLKDVKSFKATICLIWVILNSALLGEQIALNMFTKDVFILLPFVILATGLSMIIGKAIFSKVSLKVFMIVTYILLFISGLSLLV